MGTGAKVGISIGALFVLGLLWVVSSYFNYANKSVNFETRIEAGKDNNEQILGQGKLKVQEIASVTGLQADDVERVFTKAIDARYKNGMGQMMAWIQEQNPTLNGEVYTRIQREVTAMRDNFTAEQTKLRDICRGYDLLRRQPYSGFWVRITGHPSSEYEDNGGKKLCRLVTSSDAKKAFETGIDTKTNLR